MEASELRIGNWIYLPSKSKEYQISSGHDIEEIEGSDDARPIPLTPEWLERFGFENSASIRKSDSFYFIYVGASEFHINPINGVVWIERNENIFNNPALITHVHQLQNLYFTLTGEELTIKEPIEK